MDNSNIHEDDEIEGKLEEVHGFPTYLVAALPFSLRADTHATYIA
jgi:hypothetical protein